MRKLTAVAIGAALVLGLGACSKGPSTYTETHCAALQHAVDVKDATATQAEILALTNAQAKPNIVSDAQLVLYAGEGAGSDQAKFEAAFARLLGDC